MKKSLFSQKILLLSLSLFLVSGFLFFNAYAQAQNNKDFQTEGKALVSRVAPGEILPIQVKLMNFGDGEKVDVTINYKILNPLGKLVIHEKETVAVQTTASYIRDIKIPEHFSEGKYTSVTEIEYNGQKVPATSQFQFSIEKKVLGIFLSRFIVYVIIGLVLAVILILVGRFIRRRRRSRFEAHDYSKIKKEERVFYELIGDMIMQMRYQKGRRAIELAQKIEGLVVEDETGKVLDIDKDPAEIVTLLMIYYKKEFGKKADFLSKRIDKESGSKDPEVNKNISMIKKYFSN